MSIDTVTSRTHVVAFNTGAHYTTSGQRIAAWVREVAAAGAHIACFVDFDRQIVGHFPFRRSGQFASAQDFARHVLHMYDWGQYAMGLQGTQRLELESELSDVLRNGFDAFVTDREVRVIASFSRG